VYTDSQEDDNSLWTVHALDRKTGKDIVVLQEPGDPASWPGPDYDVDGDRMVWTRNGHPKDAKCDQNTLGMTNLLTGETTILDRHCTIEFLWSLPHLAGNKLIVERDLPDSKGRGNDIYLFDLSTNKQTPLTTDGRSSMPVGSDRWLVWKAAPRYSYGMNLVIYELATGKQSQLLAPFGEPSDPIVAGDWLYWAPFHHFVAYNMSRGQFLTIVANKKESFRSGAIGGGITAWDRDPEPTSGTRHDEYLEWRPIP